MLIPLDDLEFLPGQPYRSSQHNALVDASAAFARAWPTDHGPEGMHDPSRFEKAAASWLNTGTTMSPNWVLQSADGFWNAVVYPLGGDRWAFEVTMDKPFSAPEDWGLIGIANWGRPALELVSERTASSGVVQGLSAQQSITVIAVGVRR